MERDAREPARLAEDALDELRTALAPVVEATLSRRFGSDWRRVALSDYQNSHSKRDSSRLGLTRDVSVLLSLITRVYWNEFRQVLPGCRSWIEIMLNVRNVVVHREAEINSPEFVLFVRLAANQFLSHAGLNASNVKMTIDQLTGDVSINPAMSPLHELPQAGEARDSRIWSSRTVSDEIEDLFHAGDNWSADYVHCSECGKSIFPLDQTTTIGEVVTCVDCDATYTVELKLTGNPSEDEERD